MSAHPSANRTTRLALTIALPVTLATLLAAPTASAAAPGAPVFGRTGQIVLPELAGVRTGVPQYMNGLNLAMVVGNLSWGGIVGYNQSHHKQQLHHQGAQSSNELDVESVWVAPAADVFVGRRVSIGASVGYLFSRQAVDQGAPEGAWKSEGFSIGVAPRIGYAVPLGHGLSFWPRLGVGASFSQQAVGTEAHGLYTSGTSRSISGELDLAIVYHPIDRVMFKVAPQIGVGRTVHESAYSGATSSSDGTWVRVGGEATVGLVF